MLKATFIRRDRYRFRTRSRRGHWNFHWILGNELGLERLGRGAMGFRNFFLVIAELQPAILITPTIDGGSRRRSAEENAEEQDNWDKKKLCVRHGSISHRAIVSERSCVSTLLPLSSDGLQSLHR